MGDESTCISTLPPPLRSIAIKQRTEADDVVSPAPTSSFAEEPAPLFELMQIQVTVYGLTGIVSTKTEKNRRARQKTFLRKRNEKKRGNKASKDGGKSTSVTVDSPEKPNSTDVDSEGAVTTSARDDEKQPPITAVLSYRKNISSSRDAMETYLPSAQLVKQTRPEAQTSCYAATWSGWSSQTQSRDHPTISLFRVMKLQEWQSCTMAKLSTHVHETIELCISAGRGKEMVPLGICSFVVTGDEENEVIHNAPVRIPAPGTSSFQNHFEKMHKTRKKKTVKPHFSHDPSELYGLDGNANIQLGVRVFPQQTLASATERKVMDDQAFAETLQSILGGDDMMGTLVAHNETSLTQMEMDEKGQEGGHESDVEGEGKGDSDSKPHINDPALLQNAPQAYRNEAPVAGEKEVVEQTETHQSDMFSVLCGMDLFSGHFTIRNDNLIQGAETTPAGLISDSGTMTEKHSASTRTSEAASERKPNLSILTGSETMTQEEPASALPLTLVSSISESVTTRGSLSHRFMH